MKIAIAEIEKQIEILDLDHTAGGVIVGGGTSGGTTVDVFVEGDSTFTFANVTSQTFESPELRELGNRLGIDIPSSITITGGGGIGIGVG